MTASCDLPTLLARARASSPVEAVDILADDLRALLDAIEVRFLVTNVTGRSAVVYAGTDANAARVRQNGERPELVPLPGTPYETALRAQALLRRPGEHGGETIIAPVSDHGDALGVIEVRLDRAATTRGIEDLLGVTGVLAHLLIAVRRHSDLEDWAEGTESFSLAAEIQRRLLPGSYTCDTSVFAVSGWLEPANAVGGDTFDYSVDRDTLHLSITDAVGNDVNAALLASVLMGSLRNSRRNGTALAEQARRANDALAAHSAVGQFVTGQLARVDLRSGRMTLVNAGHPFPYRIRDGRVAEVPLAIDMPFGLFPGRAFRVQEIDLRPGDRILLLTDGMLERNAVRLDLPAMLTASAPRHPREVVYELAEAVLHGTGGRLDDDATILCLDWRG